MYYVRNHKNIIKNILILLAGNLLSQGFLLILSGTFWDDFAYLDYSVDGLWQQFLAAGIPSRVFVIRAVWKLPNYGYRTVVWIMYLIISIMFYFILKDTELFDDKGSLRVALLAVVVPVNTCRLSLCNVECTFGLMAFMIGFYVLILFLKNNSLLFRLTALICFLFSFLLNANLFFYIIPLLYIWVFNFMGIGIKEELVNFIKVYLKNIDFVLAPILFFVVKLILFPTYGPYEDYNRVSVVHMLMAIPYTILGTLKQIKLIAIQFCSWWSFKNIILIVAVAMAIMFVIDWTINKHTFSNLRKKFLQLVVGVIVFWAGAFPYITIRQSYVLRVQAGFSDRDSMLLPFGLAIILYSIISLLYEKDFFINIVICLVLLCGIISQNCSYLKYQRASYWQDSLGKEMLRTEGIRDNNTFLFLYDNYFDTDCGIRFYSLNGVSNYLAFNESTRLFMNGLSELDLLTRNSFLSQGYGMDNYDFNDTELDGVIWYECYYSLKETVKMKWLELFNYNEFEREINSHGKIYYYDADSEQAHRLMGE